MRAIGRVSLRAATEADEPFLRELAIARFTAPGLDREQHRALVDLQLRAQRTEYLAGFPDAKDSIVLLAGAPIGRLWLGETDEEVRVLDIALLPEHRGRGIGTALLQGVLVDADRRAKPVRLTVRRDWPRTVALYERLGFAIMREEVLDLVLERPPDAVAKEGADS